MLVCIGIISVASLWMYSNFQEQREERLVQFEEIFEIDLRPHLGKFKIIEPEAKKIIQKEVTKRITELQKEYYKVWIERQKIEEMAPDEFGSAIEQLERLQELNHAIAIKWGPYLRAKEAAEWWYFNIDLPEMPDQ
jgi:hypothetical protein